eukprot:6280-Heterococcus_DN1.PRE.3
MRFRQHCCSFQCRQSVTLLLMLLLLLLSCTILSHVLLLKPINATTACAAVCSDRDMTTANTALLRYSSKISQLLPAATTAAAAAPVVTHILCVLLPVIIAALALSISA